MAFRKPECIPLLFIIAATVLLCALGAWQLKRLAWKENLIAQVKTVQGLPSLTCILPNEEMEKNTFRKVTYVGKFLHDKELHKTSKYRGRQVGYHVLTPFQPAVSVAMAPHTSKPYSTCQDTNLGDTTFLVNRGWIPATLKEREKRPETLPEGMVTITGMLAPPQQKNPFLPDNDVENNVWLYDDLAQMSSVAGHTLHPLMVVITGDPNQKALPTPSDGKIKLRNDHLGYAITWFSLAVIGLIMFAFYYREPKNLNSPTKNS